MFDFTPSLPSGSLVPLRDEQVFREQTLRAGHNDAQQLPVDYVVAAAVAVLEREGVTLATDGLERGSVHTVRCASFLLPAAAFPAIRCDEDGYLVTSGSLQAIDLVNGVLLTAATPFSSSRTPRWGVAALAWLGVDTVGVPLDAQGSRVDALAAALDGLTRRRASEIHLHDPDRAESDWHDHGGGATVRAFAIVRTIRRADLRGRVLILT